MLISRPFCNWSPGLQSCLFYLASLCGRKMYHTPDRAAGQLSGICLTFDPPSLCWNIQARPFATGVDSTVSRRIMQTVTFKWSFVVGSDAISLRIPGTSMLVLNSVKDVQELLVKRSAIYSDRYSNHLWHVRHDNLTFLLQTTGGDAQRNVSWCTEAH